MFTIQLNSIQTIKGNIMTYFNGNGHYIANDNGDTIQVHFNDYSLFHYHYSNSVLISNL